MESSLSGNKIKEHLLFSNNAVNEWIDILKPSYLLQLVYLAIWNFLVLLPAVVSPTPLLSNIMIVLFEDSLFSILGSHISIIIEKPGIRIRGLPLPNILYAISISPTLTFFVSILSKNEKDWDVIVVVADDFVDAAAAAAAAAVIFR